jgi:hypothetical protein
VSDASEEDDRHEVEHDRDGERRPADPGFSAEGNPFWAADLTGDGHTHTIYGASREQVVDRANEVIAGRKAAAEAAKAGEAWAALPEDRTKYHVEE